MPRLSLLGIVLLFTILPGCEPPRRANVGFDDPSQAGEFGPNGEKEEIIDIDALLAAQAEEQAKRRGSAPDKPVKLVVVVVFDQLRGDYLQRWQRHFGHNGFRKLMDRGAWYSNCHYPYATTYTGPGHASILSGCSPDSHGIIANNWYSRKAGDMIYCASMERYRTVSLDGIGKPESGTPDRMLVPTVADSLKAETRGRGKVVGLSLKDRGAILPCGKQPDAVLWFKEGLLTSTYYGDTLPGWAVEFDKSGFAKQFFNQTWGRFRPELDYTTLIGPDDGLGEGTGIKQGKVFPHPMNAGLDSIGPDYYKALANSPFGNDVLWEAAKAAVEGEKLGQDDTPDLLVISYSSNDLIGHTWGPDSHEVFDVTLRSDQLVADMLTYFDKTVGAGQYTMLITSDHGVAPNPEIAAARGSSGQRLSAKPIIEGLNKHINSQFAEALGKTDAKEKINWIENASPPHIYLNLRLLKDKGLEVNKVAESAAEWLSQQNGIQIAFTRQQIMAAKADPNFLEDKDEDLLRSVRKAFHPDEAGEISFVTEPFAIFTSDTGTTHGSPHSYDTHVPLLIYGPGIPGGERNERVTPQHATPITALYLGVKPPQANEYELPNTLFE